MKQFKCRADLRQVDPRDPAYPLLDELVRKLINEHPPYDPAADGWVVLVEPPDVDRGIAEIGDADARLTDLLWEGLSRGDGHFLGIFLVDNQNGFAVVIPDAPWVTGPLRTVIAEHLEPAEDEGDTT